MFTFSDTLVRLCTDLHMNDWTHPHPSLGLCLLLLLTVPWLPYPFFVSFHFLISGSMNFEVLFVLVPLAMYNFLYNTA